MTQTQVETWCDDFLEAMQSPPDWKRLQELFNKRCTVEMPGEPKAKKFEDWKKKAEPFLAGFKKVFYVIRIQAINFREQFVHRLFLVFAQPAFSSRSSSSSDLSPRMR